MTDASALRMLRRVKARCQNTLERERDVLNALVAQLVEHLTPVFTSTQVNQRVVGSIPTEGTMETKVEELLKSWRSRCSWMLTYAEQAHYEGDEWKQHHMETCARQWWNAMKELEEVVGQ